MRNTTISKPKARLHGGREIRIKGEDIPHTKEQIDKLYADAKEGSAFYNPQLTKDK